MNNTPLLIAIFVLIGIPAVVAYFRARCLEVSIGLNRHVSDTLAEIDLERWEREL